MRTKQAFAIAAALLMMLAVFTVVGTTSVRAEDTTVVLKKPIDGENWVLGSYHKVVWTFPSGDQSQITSIKISGNYRALPWWSWEASMYSVEKVPTSCTVRVPSNEFIGAGGTQNIWIEVRYNSQPGVEAIATDYRTVTIVDNTPPTIWTPSQPQIFVLGTDAVTKATLNDGPTSSGSHLDLSSVKVTVDGRSAPTDKVSIIHDLAPYQYWMQMKTDWLSLGKHKVTVSVSDNAGNVAKASWTVQVVSA